MNTYDASTRFQSNVRPAAVRALITSVGALFLAACGNAPPAAIQEARVSDVQDGQHAFVQFGLVDAEGKPTKAAGHVAFSISLDSARARNVPPCVLEFDVEASNFVTATIGQGQFRREVTGWGTNLPISRCSFPPNPDSGRSWLVRGTVTFTRDGQPPIVHTGLRGDWPGIAL